MTHTTTARFSDRVLNKLPRGFLGSYSRGVPGLVRILALAIAVIGLIAIVVGTVAGHPGLSGVPGVIMFGFLSISFGADAISAARTKGMGIHTVGAAGACLCWAAFTIAILLGAHL